METLGNNSVTKNEQIEHYSYECILCNYKCSKKFNMDRHKLSRAHLKLTQGDKFKSKNEQNEQTHTKYMCENCNKEYISRNGLWKHKQKCNIESNIIISTNEPTDKEIMFKILKQNSELIKENSDIKELILEIVKNGTHNNTTHTNSHNKAFNLNFFLNETCKNAMNLTDFVDSIKLQLSDLMDVGELGYVNGISNIIVKNLNNLDQTVRPIHCTDKKRETMYVKDEDKWEKDEEKIKLNTAVKKVANKNIRLLPQFREKYPEYSNSSSLISDTYDKTVIEVMSGDDDNNNKIITNISKSTTILEK
jgi:ribosomal protein L37AE/L43A